MPRFDFLCTDCKSTFEHLLPLGGEPPKCLACGSTKTEKLLSPPPVIFKGGGFYKTDSKGGSPPKTTKTVEESAKPTLHATTSNSGTTHPAPPKNVEGDHKA